MKNKYLEDSMRSFNNWAESYDSGILNPLIFRRIHRQVVRLMGDLSGRRVLDVGCGTGNLLVKIHEENPSCALAGLDVSENMIEIAKRKLARVPGLELVLGGVGDAPFEDNSFDNVVSVYSLHHWPRQLRAMGDLYRVLKPGGKLIISDLSVPFFGGSGTTRILSPKKVHELFADSGFRNIQQHPSTYSGRYGYLSAAAGVPLAVFGLATLNPVVCAIATAAIAGGITYSSPNWVSRITTGEKPL
ncbi:MAG: methyltransferase domain-containing protein [Nanoarchaeota archaeon]|nr:methyltransferase domain-containing protein [Nanoarchaeota archaeon]MBU4086264.1 methyltransferase domain-containing protein [Nanoarchaeota archaeon]